MKYTRSWQGRIRGGWFWAPLKYFFTWKKNLKLLIKPKYKIKSSVIKHGFLLSNVLCNLKLLITIKNFILQWLEWNCFSDSPPQNKILITYLRPKICLCAEYHWWGNLLQGSYNAWLKIETWLNNWKALFKSLSWAV